MLKADLNNPNERKKLIAAGVLGVVAIVFLWWVFVGFGESANPPAQRVTSGGTAPPAPGQRSSANPVRNQTVSSGIDPLELQPIVYPRSAAEAPESKRNIFAYFEKPPVNTQAATPTPTPTPPPPILVTAVSPSSVYARTGDFSLEVAGDKFSPEVRINLDGRELATRYIGPQQLKAVVPASLIAVAGQRQILVRSPDGRLYSNAAEFSVNAPPTPNYSYIGILGTPSYSDIALLQDRNTRTLLNVQRGDVLSGRFRVTSISEKEVVLTDTNLKIKHSLAMSTDGEKGLGPQARPTPKVEADDEEP
jgi:hypothetical protein